MQRMGKWQTECSMHAIVNRHHDAVCMPAQVEDWETGQHAVINLDPLKAPADTAKDLYKVARKQDRTGDAIMPVMQACVLLPSCLIRSHSISQTMPAVSAFLHFTGCTATGCNDAQKHAINRSLYRSFISLCRQGSSGTMFAALIARHCCDMAGGPARMSL